MLGDELGTASNIKSRVNRQSVLGAITSAQQRLKLYNKVEQCILEAKCILLEIAYDMHCISSEDWCIVLSISLRSNRH